MNTIKLTDDHREMEVIGKQLLVDHSDIYTDKMMNSILASIRSRMPDATEEERQRKLYRATYNYWVYGNSVDEDFYFGFDGLSREEKLKFMTLRMRMEYTWHLNDKTLSHLFNNKYETYELLKPYYLRDVIQIEDESDFPKFRDFATAHPSFVVKPGDLGMALGVHKVDTDASTDLRRLFDELLEEGRQNKEAHTWSKNKAVVLEELIVQDESLARLHPASVNGIRVTTVRVGGKVTVYYPWIKVGANDTFIASAVLGGLDIGIDPDTGVLNTKGFGERGEEYACHPNTGVPFIGYRIPRWDELLTIATEVAMKLPDSINYIGWDFVLTSRGWCIMEGNYAGDFMWQVFRKQGMKEDFERLIGWKCNKTFWWQKED